MQNETKTLFYYIKHISKIIFSLTILILGFICFIPFAGSLAFGPNIIFFIIYAISYRKEFALKSWNTLSVVGLILTLISWFVQYRSGNWDHASSMFS